MQGDGGRQQLRPYVPEIAVSWLAASPELRYRSVEGSLAFVDISGFTPSPSAWRGWAERGPRS